MLESFEAGGRTDGAKVSPFALIKGDFVAARVADNELATSTDQPARTSNGFRGPGDERAPQLSPSANGQRQRGGMTGLLRTSLPAAQNGGSGAPSPRGTASGGIATALREAVKRRTTGNASQDETVIREFANGDSYNGQWKMDLVSSTATRPRASRLL